MDPAPIIVTVPHRLGKAEAINRLKAAIADARTGESARIRIVEETWADGHLTCRATLLGLPCSGSIDVGDDQARAELKLSWYQGHLTQQAEAYLQQKGAAILGGA